MDYTKLTEDGEADREGGDDDREEAEDGQDKTSGGLTMLVVQESWCTNVWAYIVSKKGGT